MYTLQIIGDVTYLRNIREWESFKIIGAGGSPASGPVKCICIFYIISSFCFFLYSYLYINQGLDWNNPANTFRSIVDAGYNLIVLSFFVGGTPRDAVCRLSYLSLLMTLLISFLGSRVEPAQFPSPTRHGQLCTQ